VSERGLLQHGVLAGLQLIGRLDVGDVVQLDLLVVLDHEPGLDGAFALADHVGLTACRHLVRLRRRVDRSLARFRRRVDRSLVGFRRRVDRSLVGLRDVVRRLVRLVGHVLLP
jgi:hypothetical protein